MKVDLCSYTKGYFVMWVSQLSEEVLQKDDCPSFFEPCKITLLERAEYIYPFFSVPFYLKFMAKNVTRNNVFFFSSLS